MSINRTDLYKNAFIKDIFSLPEDKQEKLMRSNSPHTGLWFDKYLKEQKGTTLAPYADHIRLTSKIKEPSAYEAFFKRWKAQLKTMGAQMVEAQVTGRIAAGLGGASIIENGLTFHHTYGVPIIPGSSLKGTARAYAAANLDGVWAKEGAAFRTLFGGQALTPHKDDSAIDKERKKARVGIAVFYDALPVPLSFGIHNEVMTVHHREYYQTGKKPPADWDSPTPIPFPSARGRFLIALHSPAMPEWAVSGMGILKMALQEMGVGGKTSSGYGRFNDWVSIAEAVAPPEDPAASKAEAEPDPTQQIVDVFLAGLPRISPKEGYNKWLTINIPEAYRQQIAHAIVSKVRVLPRRKRKRSEGQSWYKELFASLPDDDPFRH